MNAPRAPLTTTAIHSQSDDSQACTEPPEDNPAVSRFLNFLAADINACPERLHAVDSCLITRINSLICHVVVDLNVPLLADDE